MTALYLFDDARARALEPFASSRPVSELVAGTTLIRERWEQLLQPTDGTFFIAGDRQQHFDEPGAARPAGGTIPAGAVLVNARCVPVLPADLAKAARRAATCSMWRCGAQLAAVRVREPIDASAFADGTLTIDELYAGTGAIGDVKGWWLEDVWDLIRHLPEQITSDITQRLAHTSAADIAPPPAHATVLGEHRVAILGGSATVVEPHVVLDASAGPILIDTGAHVRAFTRLNGPCYIGREVNVMGGDISASSIGAVCKVRGELSNSVLLGHSNKGHDGFVGHSYLGRWVNLGAGTVTSNMKNTYGTVSLWTTTGLRDTGLQFLGTMFGDHVKTGIGLRLTTGTVLGTGANVFGNMPPKVVPPFSWGDDPPYAAYRIDKFVETAARMMSRRHVELSDRATRHLELLHRTRWSAEPTEHRRS